MVMKQCAYLFWVHTMMGNRTVLCQVVYTSDFDNSEMMFVFILDADNDG